jgi:Fe-S-cluster containining protein
VNNEATRKKPRRELPVVISVSGHKPQRYHSDMTRVVSKHTFDCLRCGACCAPPRADRREPFLDGWTNVVPEDIAHLTAKEAAEAVIRRDGESSEETFFIRCTNHWHDGMRCWFLEGRIGKRAPCGIYERRPETCSSFVMGSRSCLQQRQAHGLQIDHSDRGQWMGP